MGDIVRSNKIQLEHCTMTRSTKAYYVSGELLNYISHFDNFLGYIYQKVFVAISIYLRYTSLILIKLHVYFT